MIHLVGNYYMVRDEYSFIVGTKKDDKERLRNLRYYRSISEAVASTSIRAAGDSIQTGEVQTLNELCDKFRSIKEELTAAVKGECGE